MYVEDMTLEDAQAFLQEAEREAYEHFRRHQDIPEWLVWDIEDLQIRIADLTA